jgi:hypothetical protein
MLYVYNIDDRPSVHQHVAYNLDAEFSANKHGVRCFRPEMIGVGKIFLFQLISAHSTPHCALTL